MKTTQTVDWLGRPCEGYVVNTTFSPNNIEIISDCINRIDKEYGSAVFCMPPSSLHITLLDWIAPLVHYDGRNKQELFRKLSPSYCAALKQILKDQKKILVTFDTINVSSTTIYLTGHDNGEFQTIRKKFLDMVVLLPGTKQPPTIIHCSLARFTQPLDLNDVKDFILQESICFTQEVELFHLVHSMREPMLEFEVLKKFSLE